MKMLSNFIVGGAIVALGATLSANAVEPSHSPRAQEQADSLRAVPATTRDVNLANNRPVGNARAWEWAQSIRKVPSTGPSVDLAHATRPTLSARDPRYETAWRENAQYEFEVAPLK